MQIHRLAATVPQAENAGSLPVIRSIRSGRSPHSLGAQLKAPPTPQGTSSRVHRAHGLTYANAVPESLSLSLPR
jgi:hypothetical protein